MLVLISSRMGGLGLPELIIIAVILLLIFGGKKLPELGAGLGKTIKEFKHAFKSEDESSKDTDKDTKERKSS
jgi:sec-independent protein translocase protein TatA